MIARFGRVPEAGQYYRRRPGVYALLPRGRQMLLTFQDAPKPEYQLPGGGIDPGEHPMAALHREVMEETGWKIAPIKRFGVFRRFAYMPEYDQYAEKICHVVLARPVYRLGPPSEPGHSAHWVDAESAKGLLGNAGDKHFAALFLRFMAK